MFCIEIPYFKVCCKSHDHKLFSKLIFLCHFNQACVLNIYALWWIKFDISPSKKWFSRYWADSIFQCRVQWGGGIARTIWICRLMHSLKSLREGMVPSHWRVFQTEHPRKSYDIVGLVCATLIIKMIAGGKISCTTFIKSLNCYVECWSILITKVYIKVYCYSEQAQMGQRQWCKGTSA